MLGGFRPREGRLRRSILTAAILVSVAAITLAPPAFAQPVYPTVTVTVHRIQLVDPIEGLLGGQADWFYHVGYRPATASTFAWLGPIRAPLGADDVTVDYVHSFEVRADSVDIVIELCEDDGGGTADDRADISSDSFEGVDDVDCTTRPAPGSKYGGSFYTSYSLTANSLSGDITTMELGWLKTSGEFDGSAGGDTNDANLFFSITDNYWLPNANAGPNRSAYTGDILSFDGTGSTASAGSSIAEYAWDFTGDLATDSVGSVVSWTFNSKGTHTVTLTVQDSVGNTDTDTTVVTILNRPPTAAFAYSPSDPTVRSNITFEDTSTDSDGTIASWSWDFGDGNTSTIPDPVHRYPSNGQKTVTLTVTDNDGASATVSRTIVVANLNPVASFTFSPSRVTTETLVEFTDGSADEDGTIASWSWDFGDRSFSTLQNPQHTFAAAGTYEITLTVVDDDGANHSASQTMIVSSAPFLGTVSGVPVLYMVIGAALAVALAAVAILWQRRRMGRRGPAVPPPSTPPPSS